MRQPVSIAEPDYIWIKYPELAEHVDFITIHLFPFWNGVARKDAVRRRRWAPTTTSAALYPNKHVVVGEIGWPSNGDRHEYADPSVSNEAIFVRDWLNAAKARTSTTTCWKRSTSRGRRTSARAAPAPTGACSTPTGS